MLLKASLLLTVQNVQPASPSSYGWLSLFNFFVAILGLALSAFVFTRQQKHSNRSILNGVIEHFVAAQKAISTAVTAHRNLRVLQSSFKPSDENARRHAEHYQNEIGQALRNAQSEIHVFDIESRAKCSHFGNTINKLLEFARKDLGDTFQWASQGHSDFVEAKLAGLDDDYTKLADASRQMRPTFRLYRFIRNREREDQEHRQVYDGQYGLSDEQMGRIADLVGHIFDPQRKGRWVVYPPEEIIGEPSVIDSDDVVTKLSGKNFRIVFQDGTEELLDFVDFCIFIYQVFLLRHRLERTTDKLEKGGFGATTISVRLKVDPSEVMKTEMVKKLLQMVEYSTPHCDSGNIKDAI